MSAKAGAAWTLLAGALSGCRGASSVLDPAGPQAARIEAYWWLIAGVSALVLVGVTLAMLYAVWHRRQRPHAEPEPFPPPGLEHRRGRIVGTLVALTVIVLGGLLAASFATDRAIAAFGAGYGDALQIEVIGHQWWWEVHYADPVPGRWAVTANEIHIPVGRTVKLLLNAHDVIHSFWVPNLAGKQDLIPGYAAYLTFRADRAGVFRGQCAEFCGYQHAKMGLLVVAEPPADFAAWLDRQRSPAALPADARQQRGLAVFLARDCGFCHAVQGTGAAGKSAPDLTHLAGRQTLAATALPNTPGHLAAWIVDPQTAKPGNHMPPHDLDPADLEDLLAYLGSLR